MFDIMGKAGFISTILRSPDLQRKLPDSGMYPTSYKGSYSNLRCIP